MSTVKISELPRETTIAGADLIPFVDDSSAATKAITFTNLASNITANFATVGTNKKYATLDAAITAGERYILLANEVHAISSLTTATSLSSLMIVGESAGATLRVSDSANVGVLKIQSSRNIYIEGVTIVGNHENNSTLSVGLQFINCENVLTNNITYSGTVSHGVEYRGCTNVWSNSDVWYDCGNFAGGGVAQMSFANGGNRKVRIINPSMYHSNASGNSGKGIHFKHSCVDMDIINPSIKGNAYQGIMWGGPAIKTGVTVASVSNQELTLSADLSDDAEIQADDWYNFTIYNVATKEYAVISAKTSTSVIEIDPRYDVSTWTGNEIRLISACLDGDVYSPEVQEISGGGADAIGIYSFNSDGIRIHGGRVSATEGNGVSVSSSRDVFVGGGIKAENCSIGIAMGGTYSGVIIDGATTENNSSKGVQTGGTGSNIQISNVTSAYNNEGFDLAGSVDGLQLANLTAEYNDGNGFDIHSRAEAVNIIARNNGQTSTADGVLVRNAADNTVLQNVIAEDNQGGSATQRYGVNIEASATDIGITNLTGSGNVTSLLNDGGTRTSFYRGVSGAMKISATTSVVGEFNSSTNSLIDITSSNTGADMAIRMKNGSDTFCMGVDASANNIQFYRANSTPGTNTDLAIDNTGGVFTYNLKSGVDQATAGAAANELWIDTADNSIKIGV